MCPIIIPAAEHGAAEECVLPEYIVYASGAHPHGQGGASGDCGILRFPEDIHEGIVPDRRLCRNPRGRGAGLEIGQKVTLH